MLKTTITLFVLLFLISNTDAQWDQKVNNPVQNFEAFWSLFNNNYAFFEDKQINWDSLGQVHRKNISANTNNGALFHTFCEMLKPLNDAHVTLTVSQIDTSFDAARSSRIVDELKPLKKNVRKGFDEMVKTTLHKNGFKNLKTLGKDFKGVIPLFWYSDNGKVGYLRVGRCFGNLVIMNGPGIKSKLNTIFQSFVGLDALIIDIRFNPGGTDGFSKRVVGRLVENNTIGYYKQTRKDQIFDDLVTHYIKPKGKDKFLKPVYLLTNDKSVSAADVLSLMAENLENVTILGENTNGSYSDIFDKRLPNGWKVGLSNQRYLNVSKKNYEGHGTPVNIEAKNLLENYESKNDLILSTALELIEK